MLPKELVVLGLTGYTPLSEAAIKIACQLKSADRAAFWKVQEIHLSVRGVMKVFICSPARCVAH